MFVSHFTIPIKLYENIKEHLGDDSAQVLSKTFEDLFESLKNQIEQEQKVSNAELYNNLRQELATKEFVRAEINKLRAELKTEIGELKAEFGDLRAEFGDLRAELGEVKGEVIGLKARIDKNEFFLKILIGLNIAALTLLNPTFVSIIEKIFK